MLAGVLNKENLTAVLRGVVQKRKSGTLEIHASSEVYELLFQNGRLLAILPRGADFSKMISDRLMLAGQLDEESAHSFRGEPLERLFREASGVEAVSLKQAANAVQIDLMHEIWNIPDGRFEFVSRASALPGYPPLSVSPMQLLIELAEDDSTSSELLARAGCRSLDQVMLQAAATQAIDPQEQLILDKLQSKCGYFDLADAVLVSGPELRGVLWRLIQQGAVAVSAERTSIPAHRSRRSRIIEQNTTPQYREVGDAEPGDLADRWYALVQAETQSPAPVLPQEPEVQQPEVQTPEPGWGLEEHGSEHGLERSPEFAPAYVDQEELSDMPTQDRLAETIEPRGVVTAESSDSALRNLESEQEGPEALAVPIDIGFLSSPVACGNLIERASLAFLDPKRRPLIAAYVMVVFFAVLAWRLPLLLEGWFVQIRRLLLMG